MFGWLKNLFGGSPDSRPPLNGSPGPPPAGQSHERRHWHYGFAHMALRQHALEHPAATIAVLGDAKASEFLDALAQQVNEWCQENGEPVGDFGTWNIHCKRLAGMPVAVVEMPATVAPPEAYFVAIVLQTTDLTVEAMKAASARYFTLERSINLEGNTTTMMCEWTQDGTHCNLGAGPEPQVDAFLSKLKTMFS
ncbi:MAG: hypothetical protein KDA88_11710 [Planctomycetaceae bacterium]|nr:hypothetical protein [Planctomycetaceae bacterium]